MESLKSYLPNIYHNLLPSFFDSELPQEIFSTCLNCPKIKECDNEESFNPSTKCCTYFPSVPNYLIGGILANEDAPSKNILETYIKNKIGVSPMEVGASRKYWTLYHNSKDFFGKAESLKCPYLQSNGECGIWNYRYSVCLTWFCKPYSEAGKDFWAAVLSYLSHVENSLGEYCLNQAGIAEVPLKKKSTWRDLDGRPPSEENYSELWQTFEGDELSFYKKSYEKIQSLTKDQFNTILGEKGKTKLLTLQRAYDKLMNLPENLKYNESKVDVNSKQTTIRIEEIDVQFTLPTQALLAFDGKTTTKEVKQQLVDNIQLALQEDVMRVLYHNSYLTL